MMKIMRQIGNFLIIATGLLLMVMACTETNISEAQSFFAGLLGIVLVFYGNIMQHE